MTPEKFDKVLEDTFETIRKILSSKKEEYSPDTDRLVNFKTASALQGVSTKQALMGMAAKHLVSVADYVSRDAIVGPNTFDLAHWDEKIIDVINYMILLRGLVIEELEQSE